MTLDPETKARIKAEEAYRAQVREELTAEQEEEPVRRERFQWRWLILVLGILAVIAWQNRLSEPEATEIVSPMNMAEWPFQFSSGTLQCRDGDAITVTDASGNVYAMNDIALDQAREQGWYNPSSAALSTGSVGPLVREGLRLCTSKR